MVFLLRPRWLALHAFVIASSVAMVFLGRWQWHVAGQRHNDIRNYAYAVQWWLFVVFAIAFWLRVMRDARRPRAVVDGARGEGPARQAQPTPDGASGSPAQYRAYAMPQSAAIVVDDPELAAYNAYLAAIAQPAHIPAGHTRPAAGAPPGPSIPSLAKGDR